MPIDIRQLEEFRPVLTGHCYRMLGSAVDAKDAVQETMIRAWRSADRFDGRSSLGTWLYRIATNVSLDALSDRARRHRPVEYGPDGTADDSLETLPREHWIEPVPDAQVLPENADPAERLVLRESIRLAFVAALQHLPPKQRAALLLTEVLSWSAAEVAETLDSSVASVNSAIQRARSTLSGRDLGGHQAALTVAQLSLVDNYVAAFERYDVTALTGMLAEDAVLSMPPYTLWLRGRESIGTWLLGRGSACRGSKLVPVSACGSPAFGQYHDKGRTPWALLVLEMSGERIASITSFLDTGTLFPIFGLPPSLPD
jgi:RNA polymerase sigma-70 factor (ECF subfamily)